MIQKYKQADVKKGGSFLDNLANDIAGKIMWKTMTAGVCGDRFQESSRVCQEGKCENSQVWRGPLKNHWVTC